MVNLRYRLARFLLQIALIEVIGLSFLAFTVLARAGYHPRQAWQATLAAAGVVHSARLPPGAKFDRVSLELSVILSGMMAFAAASAIGLIAIAGRAMGAGPRASVREEIRREAASNPMPKREFPAGFEPGAAIGQIPPKVAMHSPTWLGVFGAMRLICAVLGFAALSTLIFNYLRHPLDPAFYWVGWVVAFSLATGFGARNPPGVGANRLNNKFHVGAYFRAAPAWLRIALIAVGVLLAVLCLRTGYIALKRPGDFGGRLLSDNFAVALAFMFFVDALAFAPFSAPPGGPPK